MIRDVTLSEQFDSAYVAIQELLNDEGIYSTQERKSAGITSLQSILEYLTRSVSSVEMFSKNEVYDEMDPKALKFILLPYFLGVLWQQKRGLDRKEIWPIAEVYFRDFLERLLESGIITSRPNILTLLEEQNAGDRDDGGDGDGAGSSSPLPKRPNSDLHRQNKIARFKQSKELESKIKILFDREKNGGDQDPALVQEMYLTLLQKYALEAEAELEAILAEKELVTLHSKSESSQVAPSRPTAPKSSLPYETFIITKSDVQKKTFGRGYPSIPVMTVEELYQDRISKGIWAKPTTIDDSAKGNPQDEESNQVREEELDEADDENRRAQLQAVDEYKDTHRRGWGNRMNRS